jgi:hypothetical protein
MVHFPQTFEDAPFCTIAIRAISHVRLLATIV